MRTSVRGVAGLAAAGLFVLSALAANAAQPAERELLGIRIWRTWREVLAKHGQPTQIEVGAVTGPTQGAPGGAMGSGGMQPMAGGPSGMMPGRPGGLPGMPGMGMSTGQPMGMGSMMGMGNPYSGSGTPYPGMAGGRGPMGGGGGKMGLMMGSGGMGGTMPGFGGPMGAGASGSPYGGMMGGGGSAMMGGGQAGAGEEGEVTWIYKRGSLTFMFLFNKDGRVIQIQEFGYKGGSPTGRGVKLGDPVARIYRDYGWADSSVNNGDQLTLDYSHKAHVTFQLSAGKVVGITVALTERSQIPTASTGMGGGMMSGPMGGGGGGSAQGE